MHESQRGLALSRMLAAGLDKEEALYYLDYLPPEEWAEVIDWAGRPPGLDACDDVEADEHWA